MNEDKSKLKKNESTNDSTNNLGKTRYASASSRKIKRDKKSDTDDY